MKIKNITLKNVKNFSEKTSFSFDKLNLVEGENGVGKSTLVVDSLLFVLYGYYYETLSKLVTKGKKSCLVEVEILHNDSIFKIVRKYPTSLDIYENGKKLIFANTRESQEFLNETFKDLNYFKKFRMVDNAIGINILEEGKTSLQKTLLSINQGFFNNIRKRLLSKKREREIHNRDTAQVNNHYPSQIRLDLLKSKINALQQEIRGYERDASEVNSALRNLNYRKGKIENSKNYFKTQKDKLYQYNECPTCKREIDGITESALLEEYNEKIKDYNVDLEKLNTDMYEEGDALEYLTGLRNKLNNESLKIRRLISKLENRIKMKDYKYTNKDVLIIKKSIEELDKFYNYFINEWIKILEPIINSVTEKIGFEVKFSIDNRGRLDIILNKEDKQFTYKELSSGQKLVISIAFKIALLLERQQEGIIVADEGLSALDEENLNHVFELFRNLHFQLVVVLHRLNNKPEGIKVIELNKESK